MDVITALGNGALTVAALLAGGLVFWFASQFFKAWRQSRRPPTLDDRIKAELVRDGFTSDEAESALRDTAALDGTDPR